MIKSPLENKTLQLMVLTGSLIFGLLAFLVCFAMLHQYSSSTQDAGMAQEYADAGLFAKAAETLKGAAQREPADSLAKPILLRRLAIYLSQAGQHENATLAANESVDLLQKIEKPSIARSLQLRELSASLLALADVQSQKRDFAGSEQSYTRSLAMEESIGNNKNARQKILQHYAQMLRSSGQSAKLSKLEFLLQE
jgi:hypothetical protein